MSLLLVLVGVGENIFIDRNHELEKWESDYQDDYQND